MLFVFDSLPKNEFRERVVARISDFEIEVLFRRENHFTDRR
jgi:hypothetical protein